MTDPLEFGPDTGLRELWVFTLFVLSDEISRWEPPRVGYPERDWPLPEALGAGPLKPTHVQVFEAGDLGKKGLRKLLVDAHGMDAEQVEADADKLDMLRGTVVLVLSGALTKRPGRFDPKPPTAFIGHYTEPSDLVPASPAIPRPSTAGHIEPPAAPAPDTRRGLILTLAGLLVLALLILAFV